MQNDHGAFAVQIKRLEFSWTANTAINFTDNTLSIPDLTVKTGDKLFVEGQSGSGKSTLLNIIAGILCPQQGEVSILGTDLSPLSAIERDRFRANHMGVIFQQFNLLPYLTVRENIRLSRLFVTDKSRTLSDLEPLLEALNLSSDLIERKASQLSIGQQQRVGVARALYHRPPLIIADEPTSALDTRNRNEFIELLLEQAAAFGTTVLFVSHDQSLAQHFDRSVSMDALKEGAVC